MDGRARPGQVLPESVWSRADKDVVGTSLGHSRLWFSLGQGLLNEVFYPRVDIPQIRDLNFVVSDGKGFWIDLRQNASYNLEEVEPGIPALIYRHHHPRFTLTLRVCPDPVRDAILIDYNLASRETLELFFVLAPRAGNTDQNQVGSVFWRGLHQVIGAQQGPFGLALAGCHDGRDALSRLQVGILGQSDAWRDLEAHHTLTHETPQAGPGVLTLAGALTSQGTLAIGFSSSMSAASTLARSSLTEHFEKPWQHFLDSWRAWKADLDILKDAGPEFCPTLARSLLVLKVHQDRSFPGAMVASLSTPWGESSVTSGGYHLVWPRDLVESAMAFLILGQPGEAHRVLSYLIATQQPDGHWFQNQWLGGRPFWQGIQLDEAAFPILLVGFLRSAGALGSIDVTQMVRRAVTFILKNGPSTDQDRWEEDAGINPFTLAVVIAALVEGADHLDSKEADFVLAVADEWNASIEEWCYVRDTELARKHGVDGYYPRIAPRDALRNRSALNQRLLIHNRADNDSPPAADQVALDFLQLVRYGLRSAKDPRIQSSVQIADALLSSPTPSGTVWHRYNGDGYGEHPDGRSFDGNGIGRGWPLLVGERGHYALAAGEDPLPYLKAMAAMTGRGGLIPEQIWDQSALPEAGLEPGKPSRSAMPLVWAHAEFVKLLASRIRGTVIDQPSATRKRYGGKIPARRYVGWSFSIQRETMIRGYPVRIFLQAPATVHYGLGGWEKPTDVATRDSGLGLHYVDLPTESLTTGQQVVFTFRWSNGRWEGRDFSIGIAPAG